MATAKGVLLALLLATVACSAWAATLESEENNKISGEGEDVESRSDYPDIDDLSSFFDFDLGTSTEKGYSNHYDSPKTSRNKYYYYYKADGPRYYESNDPPNKQVVTLGAHYKPRDDEDRVVQMASANDSSAVLSQAVVGPYQVTVVDGNSPLLSNLGLKKEDLDKLSAHTKRSITNASMEGSDSVPSATYAENPRPDYPQSDYAPNHHHHPPSNAQSYDHPKYPQYRPENIDRQYRPSEYYPADNHQPQRGYGPSPDSAYPHRSYGPGPGPAQPPPQGSYDAKSYAAVQHSSHHHQSSHNYGQPPSQPGYNQYSSPSSNHYPSPPSSYGPKRTSGEPWRQTAPVHTDWDDKQNKKPETYNPHGPYAPNPPPSSYSNTPSNPASHYQRPAYSSADKPGYRYATYSKPQAPSKPTYSATSSGSSEYASHKPSYHSSAGYSTSAKAPSRAGSVSYPASSHQHHDHHEPSKPGITIRFKAKAPSHHGSGGLNIPVSFNPLDVVKKLLPLSALNPLNNKKVTIGITIENKKENHQEYHSY